LLKLFDYKCIAEHKDRSTCLGRSTIQTVESRRILLCIHLYKNSMDLKVKLIWQAYTKQRIAIFLSFSLEVEHFNGKTVYKIVSLLGNHILSFLI